MLQTSSNVHERKSACRGKTHWPKTISYPYSVKASDPSKQTNKLASEPRARGQSKSLIFQHVLCIGSFFDNMSFVDACLQKPSLSRTELCKTEALGWMGATLKDSLLDLQREEQIRQYFENSSQLLAFVEVLSFHRCQTELSGIWTEAARLREKMSSERWEQVMASFSQPFGQKYLATCHCKFCEPRFVCIRIIHLKCKLLSFPHPTCFFLLLNKNYIYIKKTFVSIISPFVFSRRKKLIQV